MKILLFWLEIITIICIFKNILHININTSNLPIRLLLSCLLTIIWSIYIYLSPSAAPGIFVIPGIVLLLFKEKWYFRLCCFFVSAINILSNMVIYFYCIINGTSILKHKIYYAYSDIVTLLSIILVSFLVNYKITSQVKPFRKVQGKGYLLITVVTLIDFFLSSVSSLLFYNYLNITGRVHLIFAIFLMIFLSIFLLFLYFRLQYYHDQLQETNLINQRMLRLEEQHYWDLQKKNNDLRAFRHDYNYHITAMQGLASSGKLSELKTYIENLSNIKKQVTYISTNHPVADAIVNYFYETIPKQVRFQVEGKFPEQLFVSDSDLCIVLSNLLHNAVEAVTKLPREEPSKIYLSLYANKEYLTLLVENTSKPYPENQFYELQSSKTDTINHGFGLKNVNDAVKKYHGKLNLQYKEDGIFTACVYLRNID